MLYSCLIFGAARNFIKAITHATIPSTLRMAACLIFGAARNFIKAITIATIPSTLRMTAGLVFGITVCSHEIYVQEHHKKCSK